MIFQAQDGQAILCIKSGEIHREDREEENSGFNCCNHADAFIQQSFGLAFAEIVLDIYDCNNRPDSQNKY